ncbi:MAG: extracellular solute-binding protein [Oscillospiraceae bacterium]|jgi:ABC-type glycerol-3-phosphate transport system substrate-binding protein|nr:extracellular solute-binding protein [Oscillospiraceae bacterium]
MSIGIKRVFVALSAILLFAGCGQSADDKLYENLSVAPSSQAVESAPDTKRVLSIKSSGYGSPSNYIHNAVVEFMALNKDVDITVEYDDGNYGETIEKLATQLMSGQAADIIVLDLNYSIDSLLQSGYFVDLNEYIKQSADINDENYYMHMLSCFESDGKLYGLTSQFHPFGLISMRSDVPEELKTQFESGEFSYADVLRAYEQYGKAFLSVYESYSPASLFYYAYDKFIDFNGKTSRLSDPEMIDLLDMAKAIPPAPNVEYMPESMLISSFGSTEDAYKQTSDMDYGYLFLSCDSAAYSPSLLFPYEGRIYTQPQMLKTLNGNKLFSPGNIFCINKTCPDKDLAWEFIKFCIEDKKDPYADISAYPDAYAYTVGAGSVNRNNYETHARLAADAAYITGQQQFGMKTTKDKDTVIAETVDFLISLPDELNYPVSRYSQLNKIIWPDLYLYLTDEYSTKETLDSINSKVSVYINE